MHRYKNDINFYEGLRIDIITSQSGLQQLNLPSCIVLIFTSQLNLVTESGVHSSLHPNFNNQIVFAKFNLKIGYPSPYEREIGIMKRQTLTLFVDQSISSLRITYFLK